MLTKTTAQSTLQKLSGNYSTDGTALLMQFYNDSRRTVAGINGGKWPWLEIEETALTVAGQEYVEIPNHIRRVITARQQNGLLPGDVIYPLRLIFDQQRWDAILTSLLGESDVPFFAYQRNNRLYIQPRPSTNGLSVIMRGRIKLRDLTIDDYTTGTITTATTDGKTIVGTGTTWTTSMAGRYIRITDSNSDNNGDEYWYEIGSVTNATTLVLTKNYQGTSIAAGTAAYTIGQITYEPETYQMAPIYRALAQYWDFKEDMNMSQRYWRLYDGGVEAGLSKEYGGLISQMMEEANESMEGNYISPSTRDNVRGNWPPYWFPFSDATGF